MPSDQHLSCDQSRETELLLEGSWGFPGHSCDGREAAWQTGRAGVPPDTRHRRAGKAPRSKADARVSCGEELQQNADPSADGGSPAPLGRGLEAGGGLAVSSFAPSSSAL